MEARRNAEFSEPNNPSPHAREESHGHTTRRFSGQTLVCRPGNPKTVLGLCQFGCAWANTSHSPDRRMHCIEGLVSLSPLHDYITMLLARGCSAASLCQLDGARLQAYVSSMVLGCKLRSARWCSAGTRCSAASLCQLEGAASAQVQGPWDGHSAIALMRYVTGALTVRWISFHLRPQPSAFMSIQIHVNRPVLTPSMSTTYVLEL
jgi:hypothetical protein